jgi:hypothetical protein
VTDDSERRAGLVVQFAKALGDAAEYQASIEKKLYEVEGNSLRAWNVYRMYRLMGRPIPDWVLEYFDRAGDALMALQSEHDRGAVKNPAVAIAEALGMKKPGRSGAYNVFSDMDRERRKWLGYAAEVKGHIEQGSKEDIAIEFVAKTAGVHYSTVYRAWARAKEEFPELAGLCMK